MNGDWIKVHRKVIESPVWTDDRLFKTFLAILLKVNWKVGYFKLHQIQPGQMAFSWRNLPDRLFSGVTNKPSINTLRAHAKRLEKLDMIHTQRVGNAFTILTVKNWDKYQSGSHQNMPVDTPAGTQVDTPTDTQADTWTGTPPDTPTGTRPDTWAATDRRRVRKEEGKEGEERSATTSVFAQPFPRAWEQAMGVIPERFQTDQFRSALESWAAVRQSPFGGSLGLSAEEIRLVCNQFTTRQIDDQAALVAISDAAAGRWKNLRFESNGHKKQNDDRPVGLRSMDEEL